MSRIFNSILPYMREQRLFALKSRHHGPDHWARVRLNGLRIAKELNTGFPLVSPTFIEWFAVLHDSQRRDDGGDRGHGERAVIFAHRARRIGFTNELSDGEFYRLCVAMLEHSEGGTSTHDLDVAVCWDADRLDLGRDGSTFPNTDFLSTRIARNPAFLEAAHRRALSGHRK